MTFPTLVYKSPGPYNGGGSKTYDFKEARDEEHLEELLSSGWCESLSDCFAKKKPAPAFPAVSDPTPEPEKLPELSDSDEPTREEIEQQARELGIKVDGRMSDATLLKRIDEALEAPAAQENGEH